MEVGVIIRFKKYLYLSKRQALEKESSLFAQSVGNVGQKYTVMRIEKNLNVEAVQVKYIYSERCNLYDGGGTALIEYKFFNLISELDLSKTSKKRHIPFDSRYYGLCKPKYMRYEMFELILKQLTALSAMRDTVILQKCSYSTQYINGLLNSNSLKKLPLMEIPDAIWLHKI